jgi:hypothetical protein
MARPQVADGGDGLQIRCIDVNKLHILKTSGTVYRSCPPVRRVGRRIWLITNSTDSGL